MAAGGGAKIRPDDLADHGKRIFTVTDYGVTGTTSPVENTRIINELIARASESGGGTVLIPKGIYGIYTLRMRNDVTLHLETGAVLRAARPGAEGGNYDEPEVNLFAGIQDHGHSYLANSLIYGRELRRIAITGSGVLDGSNYHTRKPGEPLEYILNRWDPAFPEKRSEKGHTGTWFGNKGIALDSCEGIVLTGFTFLIGGHFALILSGCRDIWMDRLLVDTARDALDLDGSQDVTLRHSVFNSLNDDAICLKASFGAKKFMPVRNILVEDCKVTGFDAGSVYAGQYTRDKLAATDRCKPCGRVKFGTEASCGCDHVTVRRVEFIRSRGICLESCDTADMHDILIEDCRMTEVSSSPVFIRLGIRNRFPVTGNSGEDTLGTVRSDPVNIGEERPAEETQVRLDHREWILPRGKEWPAYPAAGYLPSVRRDRTVSVDDVSEFTIPREKDPCGINPANYDTAVEDGKTLYYAKKWDPEKGAYVRDAHHPIPERELSLYANAFGAAPGNTLARAWNITIRNLKVRDADPRYPILIQGLTDSPVRNVTLENIDVEYRGGITRKMAEEQRQLNTVWNFSQFGAPRDRQILPWLVNTFFAKDEGLLPRADWDPESRQWVPDPYNVPELAEVYPEPSNYGILPAYGVYARHAEGLRMKNVNLSTQAPDERDAIVLDDIRGAELTGFRDGGNVTTVRSAWRRPSGLEMVPDYPCHEERVEGLKTDGTVRIREITLPAPAPGTPPDSLYPWPTAPVPENGYRYAEKTEQVPLPRCVYRPYVIWEWEEAGKLRLLVRDPAGDRQTQDVDSDSGEIIRQDAFVPPQPVSLSVAAELKKGERSTPLTLIPMAGEDGHAYRIELSEEMPEDSEIEITVHDGFRAEKQLIRKTIPRWTSCSGRI